MNQEPLPAEIAALEKRLAARAAIHEPTLLRPRVLAAVEAELARERSVRPRAGIWRFAAAAALVALVGMNLARGAAAVTDFDLRPHEQRDLEADARQIQTLCPELSSAEAWRCALRARGGQRLILAPAPRGGSLGNLAGADASLAY